MVNTAPLYQVKAGCLDAREPSTIYKEYRYCLVHRSLKSDTILIPISRHAHD